MKRAEHWPAKGRVSVVIPTRDRPALLREAVESLLRQTRLAVQIIIVDDGSDASVLSKIDDVGRLHGSISVFHLLRNFGVAAARNFGLTKVTGEFVVFLDDDDLLHPRALELNEDFLAAHPASEAVVCRSRMFLSTASLHNDILKRPECHPRLGLVDQFSGKRLEKNPFREILRFGVPINAIMFRKGCLETVAFQTDLHMGEDTMLLLNLARRGCRFAFHARFLSFVRFHSGNTHCRPDAAVETVRFLLALLTANLPTAAHDRFICHARLLKMSWLAHDRSLRPRLYFLLRCPHLLILYGFWYQLILVKKKRRWRELSSNVRPVIELGIGP
jgi:glycosyltransferase involved in cell wall biosynthesis